LVPSSTPSAAAAGAHDPSPPPPPPPPLQLVEQPEGPPPSPSRAARVGFVSTHFSDHSIGRMLVDLFAHIVRKHRPDAPDGTPYPTHLFVFAVDAKIIHDPDGVLPDPVSGVTDYNHFCRNPEDDAISGMMRGFLGDVRYRCLPAHQPLLREQIALTQLDFLIFADLGMDFVTYMLAHARLARYQAAWWGHPITSGVPAVDFFFGLDIEVPDAGHAHYSEQLVRMDVMNAAPVVRTQQPPDYDRDAAYVKMGVAQGTKIAAVLGRLFKLHPDFDAALVAIMQQSPANAVVVLVTEDITAWNQRIYDRLLVKAASMLHGDLPPPGTAADNTTSTSTTTSTSSSSEQDDAVQASRRANARRLLDAKLRFVNFASYADLLGAMSVALDTFPYGGCLTTHDALSNFAPMVSFPAEHVRGRYTLGMYTQMGHTALIARNVSEYVALAVRLLSDDGFQQEQSQRVQEHYTRDLHKNDRVAMEWLHFIHSMI